MNKFYTEYEKKLNTVMTKSTKTIQLRNKKMQLDKVSKYLDARTGKQFLTMQNVWAMD